MIDGKVCTGCHTVKPFSEYWACKHSKDGFDWKCKACTRELTRAWNIRNKEKLRQTRHTWYVKNKEKHNQRSRAWQKEHPNVQRASNVRRKFNLSLEEYDDRLAKQNHRCWMCDTPQSVAGQGFGLDHDHVTGKPRAFLCKDCNVKVGFYEKIIHSDFFPILTKYLEMFKEE